MSPSKIVALIPAWNEAEQIGATLESLLQQTRTIDQIVVIPNGCKDNTADIARSYITESNNLIVLELPKLKHRKSEALNIAWREYAMDADIVISIDADTTFDPDAIKQWEREFSRFRDPKRRTNRMLGGSTAKAIVLRDGYWGRMQKQEYAKVVDSSLIRGTTSVLAGAGTAFSGPALRQVAAVDDGREGPWSYDSMTEDYEITVMLRKLNWVTVTSPYVRMYTDGMPTLKALWGQRMKWGVGQYHELMRHGITRYTLRDWGAVMMTALLVTVQLVWMALLAVYVTTASLHFDWFWWTLYPVTCMLIQLQLSGRIAYVDRKDRWYAITVIPYAVYGTIGVAWIIWAWVHVIYERCTKRYADRWELQSIAES